MSGGSANPPAVLFDTDALIQLYVARFVTPLKCFRERFAMQPAVTPEVDAEVRSHFRHQGVAERYKKAEAARAIQVLDVHALRAWKPSLGDRFAETSPDALLDQILDRASQYHLHVDLGEAYTYAAAVELGLPAVSNDANAIRALRNNAMSVPVPMLRCFDVIALCVQAGFATVGDADDARRALREAEEHLPSAFRNAKFDDGIASFAARITDASVPALPGTAPDALRLFPT